MVRARGFEPLRISPLDPKSENGSFLNPLILVRFSRNLAKGQQNLIYIHSSLFYHNFSIGVHWILGPGWSPQAPFKDSWIPVHQFESKAQHLSEKIRVEDSCTNSESIGGDEMQRIIDANH
jgi:hypothetical protein